MSDKPTDYFDSLRDRRVKAEPWIYRCRHDGGKKVRFDVPLALPAERGQIVIEWMYHAKNDIDFAMTQALRVLGYWVGETGYDLIVNKDKLTIQDVWMIMGDAMDSMQQVIGGPGESQASGS